jgi:site-specific recombinase XerC
VHSEKNRPDYSIDPGDIEIYTRSGKIHIRKGKNAKERNLPLPKPARDALTAWLDIRGKLSIKHEVLFVDLRGTYNRLSMRSMQSIIGGAGLERQELPVFVTLHILRHT